MLHPDTRGSTYLCLDTERCRLVRGARGAAIYDFSTGNVIAVSPTLAALVVPGTQSFALTGAPESVSAFASSMVARQLGSVAEEAEPTEDRSATPPPVRFAWLELTQRCNLRCVHCYASCGEKRPAPAGMKAGDWERVLGELRSEGVTAVQFVGGEPTLVPELVALLFLAGALRFETVELFTNATLLAGEHLRALVSVGGQLATTLYAREAAVHDRVTGIEGSHQATRRNIEAARANHLPVRVGCVVTAINEGRLGGLEDFVRSLGASYDGADPVRPVGRGAQDGCRTSLHRRQITGRFRTTRGAFARNRCANPCWAGKLAVIDTGEVLPCVFAREEATGNVLERPLSEIVADEPLRQRWALSKDVIETCGECEYRYACHDCRPLAAGLARGHRLAKTAGCSYNPRTCCWE